MFYQRTSGSVESVKRLKNQHKKTQLSKIKPHEYTEDHLSVPKKNFSRSNKWQSLKEQKYILNFTMTWWLSCNKSRSKTMSMTTCSTLGKSKTFISDLVPTTVTLPSTKGEEWANECHYICLLMVKSHQVRTKEQLPLLILVQGWTEGCVEFSKWRTFRYSSCAQAFIA